VAPGVTDPAGPPAPSDDAAASGAVIHNPQGAVDNEPPHPAQAPEPGIRERLELDEQTIALLEELQVRYLEAVDFGFLGPREGERLRERHLDDALGLALVRRPGGRERWADLGSGAGLPGLPLAAAFPGTRFTLVDAHKRRLDWVERTAGSLGLENLTVVHERLEDYGNGAARGRFDVAVARALGQPPVVLELGLPLVRVGGALLVPRGRLPDEERRRLVKVARQLGGGRLSTVHNPAGGSVDHPGVVITITKVAATSRRFPRRAGIPQRQPLG
jgi:16S rRNA (guanine527-N7)-methyltransferase